MDFLYIFIYIASQINFRMRELETIEKSHGRCSCCGGLIMSRNYLDNALFEWFCKSTENDVKCKNYGADKPCKNCILENQEIINKRQEFRKIIRDNILNKMERFGCCITGITSEIAHAMLDDIKNGTIMVWKIIENMMRFEKLKEIGENEQRK